MLPKQTAAINALAPVRQRFSGGRSSQAEPRPEKKYLIFFYSGTFFGASPGRITLILIQVFLSKQAANSIPVLQKLLYSNEQFS